MGMAFQVLVAAIAASSLVAQNVTATITALTPIQVQATLGAQQLQATQPAGPLGPSNGIAAGGVFAPVRASVAWSVTSEPEVLTVGFGNSVFSSPPSGMTGLASVSTHEFLVTFVANGVGPRAGYITMARQTTCSLGQPYPSVDLDINNDGIIDFVNYQASVGLPIADLTIGRSIRVVMQTPDAIDGSSSTTLTLSVVPNNDLIYYQATYGCADFGAGALLEPVQLFADRGLQFEVNPGTNDPMVFVIGMQAQPVVLPPQFGNLCLLIPAPDYVLYEPLHVLQVPLPAAVRPVQFYVQGVFVTPTGLAPTGAWFVDAY